MRTHHSPGRDPNDGMTRVDHPSDGRVRHRIATVLIERRDELGRSRRELARQAGVDHRMIRKAEHARLDITPASVAQLAEIYGLDPDALLPSRLPLEIRPFGVVATNGVAMSFTPGDETSLLASYLRLIRSVRNQEKPPVIELRRDDIGVLAEHLGWDGETVVARLSALMGVTNVQRRVLVSTFAAGAAVVSLSSAVDSAVAEQHSAAFPGPAVTARPPWATADLAVPQYSWSPESPGR